MLRLERIPELLLPKINYKVSLIYWMWPLRGPRGD